jgi:excisionase family DNA binding protein
MSSRDDVFGGLVEMIADAVAARIMEPPPKTAPVQKRLVTVKEAAMYMGCSPRTIRRLIDGGRLERVGTDRFIRIDRVDLDELIDHSKDRAL